MYNRATGPRSVGGVLDEAVRLYRTSFRDLLPFVAVSILLLALPPLYLYLTGLYGPLGVAPARGMVGGDFRMYMLILLLVWLAQLIAAAGLLLKLEAIVQGRPLSTPEAWSAAFQCWPRMIGATFLLGLILALAFSLELVPGIALIRDLRSGDLPRILGLAFAFLLLLTPAVYLLNIFQFVMVIVAVEDEGVTRSFGISRRLVKGHWWRSATIMTVAVIMLIVLGLLAQGIAGIVAGIVRPPPGALFATLQISALLSNIIQLGWFPCVLIALYHDLKLRQEGEDLALRVDALAAR